MKDIQYENEDGSLVMTLSFYADGSYVIYYYTEEMNLDESFTLDEEDKDFILKMIGIA